MDNDNRHQTNGVKNKINKNKNKKKKPGSFHNLLFSQCYPFHWSKMTSMIPKYKQTPPVYP